MTIADMTMAEARRDERVRAFLRARICFNNNASTIDCTVKNISASGAKIEMSSAVSVPSEFDLDVPQKGRIYRARLMWRDASSLGVQFVDRSAETEQLDSHAARLQRENKKLKATIALLTKRLESLGQDVSADF